MVIVSGWSAIAYWRTPPIICDASVLDGFTQPDEHPSGPKPQQTRLRSNASEATRLVYHHAYTDLIGVPLPIRVLSDSSGGMHQNPLVHPSRLGKSIPREFLHALGGGLYVASPTLALQQVARTVPQPKLISLIDEFCGLYAVHHPTRRERRVLDELVAAYRTSRHRGAPGAYACYNEHGRFETTHTDNSAEAWLPAFDRSGNPTNLWKRPPLIRTEQFVSNLEALRGRKGSSLSRRAGPLALDGSGSPLETCLALLLFLPEQYGGEGWPAPQLNRRIAFDPDARKLAGMGSCVGDMVWERPRAIIEVNGFEYHADRNGFFIQSGRTAALQSMGYVVLDVNYRQIADLDQFETMLSVFSDMLGFPLHARTKTFLARREELHRFLMSDFRSRTGA